MSYVCGRCGLETEDTKLGSHIITEVQRFQVRGITYERKQPVACGPWIRFDDRIAENAKIPDKAD